jgi:uncharacterized protein
MASSYPYSPPLFLFSPHLETIFPALLRRVDLQAYSRERIKTPDEDFLDLDWLNQGADKVVILSHGLEGNSTRPYVKGMAKALFGVGYDILAWNFRGCSEEMNRQLRFYHSGATDDLEVVVQHAITKKYKEIFLVGFSLGGNLTLKYLGEKKPTLQIKKAVAISVPMELESSCKKISESSNWMYANRFLKSLKKKITAKAALMSGLDTSGLQKIKTLLEFDNRYTAPLHGFENGIDYYRKCSAVNFVEHISTPTLIINTLNDPFLSKACFPTEEVKNHRHVKLEILLRGGHVGFTQFNKNGLYWSEQRTVDFFNS